MAKDNMLLGFARGKVGDLVFYRHLGNQVTRARNAAPANPRTARQSVQRSILKSVSLFYSLVSGIADHSIEGVNHGAACQAEFSRINLRLLRDKVLNGNVNLSDPASILASQITNFASKDNNYPVFNDYIISKGTVPTLTYDWSSTSPALYYSGAALPATPTYQQFIDALSLMRGDQLTFMWFYGDDNNAVNAGLLQGVEISRIILEPANGDMSTVMWSGGTPGDPFVINSPNPANTGRILLDTTNQGRIVAIPDTNALGDVGESRVGLAFAAIVSRNPGGSWKRSTQSLVYNQNLDNDPARWYLGDAAASFMDPGDTSPLYLNQAEQG